MDQARAKMNDPETQERMRQSMESASQQAREAASKTKRGIATIVDKIDPGLLADIVIKATALQEKANASLRSKGSPYRVSEIVITATIPPQVSFAIGRVGEIEEELTGSELSSTQIAADEGLHRRRRDFARRHDHLHRRPRPGRDRARCRGSARERLTRCDRRAVPPSPHPSPNVRATPQRLVDRQSAPHGGSSAAAGPRFERSEAGKPRLRLSPARRAPRRPGRCVDRPSPDRSPRARRPPGSADSR